jgi:hypothetical protein
MKRWFGGVVFLLMLNMPGFTQAISEHSPWIPQAYQTGRPYTRWWWHAMKFTEQDVEHQLVWLRDQGFGGVEVAFIYPVNRDPYGERFPWLGEEWQKRVIYTKRCADSLGLGCDFTYGTLWPFGGTFVSDEDRTRVWNDPSFKQPLRLSWTHPDTGNVLNHLDKAAFDRYAQSMSAAFAPAMAGSTSALFCDSWEVESKHLWTPGFEKIFQHRYRYNIVPFMDSIYTPANAGPRYDYMKLISDLVLEEFYVPFHQECRKMGGISRVQVAGAPTDLLRAYASVDIPETEAMLYNPPFSQIVASAASLTGKPIVSAESFTCLYGWPRKHMFHEQTADLKLVADALFANGVNQHIWHGTPFNPKGVDTIFFYATVHVGTRGSVSKELVPFNQYLTRVSRFMRAGRPYSDIAVYLPTEDAWIAGELPPELQMPWSWGHYEMRYNRFPEELAGYHPTWINSWFLNQAEIIDNKLLINEMHFDALYVDAQYLDLQSLNALYRVAALGLPVCLKRVPKQAGHLADTAFQNIWSQLIELENVVDSFTGWSVPPPLVQGENLPEFRARLDGNKLIIFFANPLSKGITYPLPYGASHQEKAITRDVTIRFNGISTPVQLVFKPYQSLLLNIDPKGQWSFEDIEFTPATPAREDPNTDGSGQK